MSHTGVPKGSTCTFGKFECALGLMCEGSWRQTGNEGVCHCDRLFGFHGPECSELSFTTYMLVACALAPLILAVFVFGKSAQHIVHFYANAPRGLYLTAGGRAILCTTTCSIAACFETVGLILHALRIDRAIFFVKYVMVPTHGLIIAAFVGATLSVSAVWLQMIEKARIDKLKKTQVYLYPGLAVSSFATFGLIAVVSAWVYLRSNSMFPILGALFQMVLSLSFRVAGQRVNALLDIVLDTRDEVGVSTLSLTVVDKTRAISEKIKRTTSFMTWSSGVLCVLFVVSALTFPAQVPLYPSQNNLPRCMSGQVAAALVRLFSFSAIFFPFSSFLFLVFREN